MLEHLRKRLGRYEKTAPITNVEEGSVSFIRDKKFLKYLKKIQVPACVITHTSFKEKVEKFREAYCPSVEIYYTDWPEYEFTLFHNYINKGKKPPKPYIGEGCKIHKTALLDVEGLKVVVSPDGKKIPFIHVGCVMIGDNVSIGPYTVVHRGTFGVTTIQSGCAIGAFNNIGHNSFVGSDSVMAVGVILNGGVTTGSNCWFGSRSVVKHYVNICDDVVIGMGSVVTKDIKKSGIYFGSPAKYMKPMDRGWNF